ncbi:hypothetical protein [Tumebacillus permanentifrigoris]|uniref:Uncharacterized protein n=1 Tax=Tumebacillus permanentifrigoris TaxID=378543 RepID=A0A316D5N6_9BACL|nr:hypothetical protein [Tumebacillus permanentifrigoris]PWK06597.1 hypothetical protein C7459_11920 [Tumebacillus permanentifrigoris]
MQNLHAESVEHIFQILNDVKAEQLPVSDAVDSLAYWFHEAFERGEIGVEKTVPDDEQINDEGMWT